MTTLFTHALRVLAPLRETKQPIVTQRRKGAMRVATHSVRPELVEGLSFFSPTEEQESSPSTSSGRTDYFVTSKSQ